MTSGTRRTRRGEAGQLMAGVMVLLAIMLIFSTIVFQSWEEVLRRDHEAEMMFRAQEIVRAIVRYRNQGKKPLLKLEELLEPSQDAVPQYYLRRAYLDPLVPDGRWGLIYDGPGGQLLDPNAEEFEDSALDLFGSAALSGDTKNLSRQQRKELNRRRAAGRQRAKWDPNRTQFNEDKSDDSLLEGQKMAGGKLLNGLPIAGVKSLAQDMPFRVYQGHTFYTDWLFTYKDLERQRGGKPPKKGKGGKG